jgi:hypothetical protein
MKIQNSSHFYNFRNYIILSVSYILLTYANMELCNFNSLPNSISVMKSKRTVGHREIRSISKYGQGRHKTRDT